MRSQVGRVNNLWVKGGCLLKVKWPLNGTNINKKHLGPHILTPFKVPRSCNLYSLFCVFTVITACCLSTLLD